MHPDRGHKSAFFRLFWGRDDKIRRFKPLNADIALWIRHDDALGLKPLQDREADIALDTRPVADIAHYPAELEIDGAVAEAGEEYGRCGRRHHMRMRLRDFEQDIAHLRHVRA